MASSSAMSSCAGNQGLSASRPCLDAPVIQNQSQLSHQWPSSAFNFQHQNADKVLRQSHSIKSPPKGALRHLSMDSYGRSDARNPSSESGSGPARRRISRACDQCNQLRTKCDGQNPCAHCVEFNLRCEYNREKKKRGKASKKDLARQAAMAAASLKTSGDAVPEVLEEDPVPQQPLPEPAISNGHDKARSPSIHDASSGALPGSSAMPSRAPSSATSIFNHGDPDSDAPKTPVSNSDANECIDEHGDSISQSILPTPSLSGLSDFATIPDFVDTSVTTNIYANPQSMPGYINNQYPIQSIPAYGAPLNDYATETHPIDNIYLEPMDLPSSGWTTTVATSNYPITHQSHAPAQMKYPVLQSLIPHLGTILSVRLANELLEQYFRSSSSVHMHPMSPYVLGYVFRKRSVLHPTHPRQCTPALLASMLWVAAQTCDASYFTMPPSARGRICQKLLELTIRLLKPLVHGPSVPNDSCYTSANIDMNGVAVGGFGMHMLGANDGQGPESGNFGASGVLDDVVTYIHLATVVSASEYKGSSLRWWNAAFSLARELKLGVELPYGPVDITNGFEDAAGKSSIVVSEEEREERRRIWWLVYLADRHLSLCYNKPLFLLDIECEGLYQPMEEGLWQSGDFEGATTSLGDSTFPSPPQSAHSSTNILTVTSHTVPQDSDSSTSNGRKRGPNIECTGHSIFGYFLPLMTILGEIVDFNHTRNHPRFGVMLRSAKEMELVEGEIRRQLDVYESSLSTFEQKHLEPQRDSPLYRNTTGEVDPAESRNAPTTESVIQTRIVLAYSTHILHVLHILLHGHWDPLSLFIDADNFIASPAFLDAMSHAVSAAEALEGVLEYDPGLEFMTFFVGVYLLQGSFLLLLICDKLGGGGGVSKEVVRAGEIIVRAHESCVATLNTEYQRNFRKVMRSALAQVKGRMVEGSEEQQRKRREVLGLYRWTGNGTGLAL